MSSRRWRQLSDHSSHSGIRRAGLIAAPALSLFVALAGAAAFSTTGNVRPSASYPPGDPARGAQLGQACLSCHGDVAVTYGDPPFTAPRLRGQRASSIFYALQDYRAGRRTSDSMEPYAAPLTDQQMRDISVYLAGPPKPAPQPRLAGSPAHALAVTRCGLCHGETGMGEMQGVPVLTGQDRAYLEHAMREYRNGGRTEPTMAEVAKKITPAEIAETARYYAAQTALEHAR